MATNTGEREVLVFNGPGICPLSRDDLVDSLRIALASHYWVGTIDHEGLRAEDWTDSCALLVFPHCTRRQPYDALDVDLPTIRRIRQFVVGGGSFLGICGGAYFASKAAEWDGSRWGSANLAFWPWLSEGPQLRGGAQTHEFTLSFLIAEYANNGQNANSTPHCDLHYDGGGAFIPPRDCESTHFALMGSYSTGMCAGVTCTVGDGRAVLWHARLERSFRNRDVRHGFRRSCTREYDVEVCVEGYLQRSGAYGIFSQPLEYGRFRVLRETLQRLDLQTASETTPQRLFSPRLQYLISTPTSRPQNPFSHLQTRVVSAEHEDFEFQPLSWVTASDWARRAAHHREANPRQRCIWVICPAEVPHQWSHAPHFNLTSYFELLASARGHWRPNTFLGNNVLYGDTVTSTQTQLTL
jgi:biotin--protein ligase